MFLVRSVSKNEKNKKNILGVILRNHTTENVINRLKIYLKHQDIHF